ncbi:MAG: beta-lactamase family protein [Gemmatimonadetes bacterium]|nr:beta-lactamase family protein [Gemmatimonadota bacterium]
MRRLAVLLALSAPLAAQRGAPPAFDPARLARIDTVLQHYVDANRLNGAVGLVMRDGKVVYEHAAGFADKEAGRRMATNSIFRIASQTKAITSTAVLILAEEGKLTVNDPVSRWIPSFAKTTVATRSDTGRVITPATRRITIRDLLTHSAGISYGTDAIVRDLYEAKGLGPAAGYGWYTADKSEEVCETMDRLGTLPFVSQPGARFVYGYNTDILGCIVERASGQPLDVFIRERITKPLGMNDTYFFLPPEKRDRLVAVYMNDSTGHAVRAPDGAKGQGHYVDGPRHNFAGGAGIVSTARDYARFLEMIRNGGTLDGHRILAPHTVRLMTTNQLGTTPYGEGLGYGFGFETVERYGASGPYSVGSFGWGGAYGSTYKVDPAERMTVVLMINVMPLMSDIQMVWPSAVFAALTGR